MKVNDSIVALIRRLQAWPLRRIGKLLCLPISTVHYWRSRTHLPSETTRAPPRRQARATRIRDRRFRVWQLLKERTKLTMAKKHRGRPSRVPQPVEMVVVRVVPRYLSARNIQDALAQRFRIVVSKSTVTADLHHLGAASRVRPPTTVLVPDKPRRVEFCRTWMTMSLIAPATRILFSDEKIFWSNDFSQRRQWVAPGERAVPRDRQRWPNSRLMAWCCIGVGVKFLVLFPATERLTCTTYISRCLMAPGVLTAATTPNTVFQQDNASPHTGAVVTQFLNRHRVDTLSPWPPRSPDLNPVELLWARLQRDVAALHPISVEQLEHAIRHCFSKVTQREIDVLCLSFPARCHRVFDRGGDQLT